MMWPFNRTRDKPGNKKSAWERVLSAAFTRSTASVEGSEVLFSAVTRIASSCAMAPMHLYRGCQRMVNDWREQLLNRAPSPKWSGYDLLNTWQACCEATGNGYLLKVPGPGGRVEALDVLNPEYVEPVVDEDSGDVWYRIEPPDGKTLLIHGYHILHIRHISTGGVKGINPVKVLTGTLTYDNSIKSFSLSQIDGVNSSVVLNVPAAVSAEKRAKAVENFRENYKKSRGSLIVLDAGITATILAKSPIDAHVLDVERITTNRVARVYMIPPHLLGDYTNSSYESNENSTLEYVMHTIAPRLRQSEAEFNRKWLTEREWAQGCRWVRDLDALIRTDALTSAQVDQQRVRGAGKTPNEIREALRLPPVPGGDVLLASRDLDTLQRIVDGTARPGNGG